MLKSIVHTPSIRLLALDIDGTLLNSQFQISEVDMTALRRAREVGIEVVLVTGRRHDFAFPIAQQLGFDLWLISSNGAITRSLATCSPPRSAANSARSCWNFAATLC
jgi:hydroxymethylpyrimidine pyrophosphatase-like HAD family hydrolase